MISEIMKQDIIRRRNDVNNYLIRPFIPRIKRWVRKADKTKDAFDKYLALFISMNMFYNLWAKIKHPTKDYETFGDGKKFRDTLELIDSEHLPFTNEDIDSLISILEDDNLIVAIKKKEDGKWVFDDVVQNKFRQNSNDNEQLAKYMWEALYKIRCNLVHGAKGYEAKQIRLLNKSSDILKKIIDDLIIKLNHFMNQ